MRPHCRFIAGPILASLVLAFAPTADAAQSPGPPPPEVSAPAPKPPRKATGRVFAWDHDEMKAFRAEFGDPLQFVWSRANGGLGIAFWRPKAPQSGKPEDVAAAFLKRWQTFLRIGEAVALEHRQTLTYPEAFTYVLFQQVHRTATQKLDVREAGIDFYLTPHNAIWQVVNRTVPGVSVSGAVPPLDRLEVCANTIRDRLKLPLRGSADATGPFVLLQETVDVYAYRLVLPASKPFGTWEVLADARDCSIISIRDLVRYAEPVGDVFDPNPIVVSKRGSIRPGADALRFLTTVSLTDLRKPDRLSGRFVDTSRTEGATESSTGVFQFRPPTSHFAETMAYFHVTRALSSLVDIWPKAHETHSLTLPISVNAFGSCRKDGRSCYDPGTLKAPESRHIVLGRAVDGIADAEDAHVIVHEIGHLLLDHLSPNFDTTPQARALAEGFADYLALKSSLAAGFEPRCFAPWVAVRNSAVGSVPCLRRADWSPWPQQIDWQAHDAPWRYAYVWSSTLLDFEQVLRATPFRFGDRQIDKIILKAHASLPPRVGFIVAANKAMYLAVMEQGGSDPALQMAHKFFSARGMTPIEH